MTKANRRQIEDQVRAAWSADERVAAANFALATKYDRQSREFHRTPENRAYLADLAAHARAYNMATWPSGPPLGYVYAGEVRT